MMNHAKSNLSVVFLAADVVVVVVADHGDVVVGAAEEEAVVEDAELMYTYGLIYRREFCASSI